MRKTILAARAADAKKQENERGWLDLEQNAIIEVTSEDPNFPVESALRPNGKPGWRAAEKGEQTIRVIFDEPIRISKIHLGFLETEAARSQEFVLRWAAASEGAMKEIVRQQWNFSPQGSTTETEEYNVNLANLLILELHIRPDMNEGKNIASLSRMLVA